MCRIVLCEWLTESVKPPRMVDGAVLIAVGVGAGMWIVVGIVSVTTMVSVREREPLEMVVVKVRREVVVSVIAVVLFASEVTQTVAAFSVSQAFRVARRRGILT